MKDDSEIDAAELLMLRERHRRCQHDLYEASKPYISIISDIYSLYATPFIIVKDGEVIEQGYRFTPEQKAVLDEAQKLWSEERQSILDAYQIKGGSLL